jgi:D-methionine transport system permease protein
MSPVLIGLLLDALQETLVMVGVSALVSAVIGIPLGVLLVVTARGHILESPIVNAALGIVVNVTRSTPFIILLIAIIPLTRLIVGTSIGTAAGNRAVDGGRDPFCRSVGRGFHTRS